MSLRLIAVTGLVMIGAACASGGGRSARRAACVLSASDAVFAAQGPVYRDCAVDRVVRPLASNVLPDVRPEGSPEGCHTADVEFVVDTMGMAETQTAHVVRANDQQFAESVIAALGKWKYEPAILNGNRVRQIVVERRKMGTLVAPVAADVLVPKGSPPPRVPPAPAC